MGRYEREARHHADRIKHYYDHAGGLGYSQAENHYSKLTGLIGQASRSKNDKSDVIVIQRKQRGRILNINFSYPFVF